MKLAIGVIAACLAGLSSAQNFPDWPEDHSSDLFFRFEVIGIGMPSHSYALKMIRAKVASVLGNGPAYDDWRWSSRMGEDRTRLTQMNEDIPRLIKSLASEWLFYRHPNLEEVRRELIRAHSQVRGRLAVMNGEFAERHWGAAAANGLAAQGLLVGYPAQEAVYAPIPHEYLFIRESSPGFFETPDRDHIAAGVVAAWQRLSRLINDPSTPRATLLPLGETLAHLKRLTATYEREIAASKIDVDAVKKDLVRLNQELAKRLGSG